jgi:hypothetical protein
MRSALRAVPGLEVNTSVHQQQHGYVLRWEETNAETEWHLLEQTDTRAIFHLLKVCVEDSTPAISTTDSLFWVARNFRVLNQRDAELGVLLFYLEVDH